MQFGDTTLVITVEDERGKIPLNGIIEEEVRDLFAAVGVNGAQLDTLADRADMPALIAMFEADIDGGQDRIGVGAWRSPTGIRFHFPVSIVAWEFGKRAA